MRALRILGVEEVKYISQMLLILEENFWYHAYFLWLLEKILLGFCSAICLV
jgi:hypothetical protein